MKIGIQELLVVFIVALFVLGPDKLPVYAKKLGQALGQFRKFSEEATKDIRESIVEPLEEAQRPLKEALEPVTELEKSVRGNVTDIKKSFADIGKPPKANSKPTANEISEQSGPQKAGPSVQTPPEPEPTESQPFSDTMQTGPCAETESA